MRELHVAIGGDKHPLTLIAELDDLGIPDAHVVSAGIVGEMLPEGLDEVTSRL